MAEINGVGSNSAYDQIAAASDQITSQKNVLGQDDFLKLLVTQMSNQDPTNPQDPGDFLGQLAQFGTVDGINKLNQSMAMLNAGIYSSQALQASSLVGRTVQVESPYGVLTADQGLHGAVELPENMAELRITMENEQGEVIKVLYLGDKEKGLVDFTWDGIGDDGKAYEAGQYTMRAEANVRGQNVGLPTYAVANVDSVTIGQGDYDIALNLNGLGVKSLYDVAKIS